MLTEIEWMLAMIRHNQPLTGMSLDLREGPRPETERALGAAFKRAIFTCGYCGGHECNRIMCGVKECERGSSSRSDDR